MPVAPSQPTTLGDRLAQRVSAGPARFLATLAAVLLVAMAAPVLGIGVLDPAAGVALAAVVVFKRAALPAVAIAGALGFLWRHGLAGQDVVALPALGLGVARGLGAALEAAVAAWVFRRIAIDGDPFSRMTVMLRFVAVVAFATPVLAALPNALVDAANGGPLEAATPFTLWAIWIGDALGVLLFGSLCLSLLALEVAPVEADGVEADGGRPDRAGSSRFENTLLLGLAAIAHVAIAFSPVPLPFALYPFLIWAGLRCGAAMIMTVTILVAVGPLVFNHLGLWSDSHPLRHPVFHQLEIATKAVMVMLVAVAMAERRRLFRSLEGENQKLEARVAERTREIAEASMELERRQRRIVEELNTAAALQRGIVPTAIRHFDAVAVSTFLAPAFEVGGDFLDLVPVDRHRLGIVVADVSGKGVAAAFYMAAARSILRMNAARGKNPAACLGVTNDLLCFDNPLDLFVTAFYGVFDQRDGSLRFASAGHLPPLVARADGRVETLVATPGVALGVLDGVPYEEATATLAVGDTLLVFTDGVTEAFDAQGEAYGWARLMARLSGLDDRAPQAVVDRVVADVQAFAAGVPQADDIACVALQRLASAPDAASPFQDGVDLEEEEGASAKAALVA